ncbi:Protein CBG21605 [Caenorhabditis briggsae]|uniref:Protein CBG21605 n=1 Tax=Caenorhabditis briggsae TaxID=6238 RepID=A8Y069_CAEBR|nr:Protein CBG21605 [Caenorhabditis briggsae]CAP38359.2 Protein CBG21605 [Caenorhabditis briggsae]
MVHEHFLEKESREFCAEYEFLKRNSARGAHRNVCEMLMSTRVPVSKSKNFLFQSIIDFLNISEIKTTTAVLRKRREDFTESTDTDSDSETPDEWYNDHEEKLNVDYSIDQLETVFEKCYRDEFLRRNNKSVDNEKLIEEAGVMERLILRDASARYWRLLEYEYVLKYFSMKVLRVTRANEKVKTFFLEFGTGISYNWEYWRCQEDGRTMIWKGYHANFYSCRRFQQWASHHIHYCFQRVGFQRLIFETEERNQWDPEIDPFCNFYKQLANRLQKAAKFSLPTHVRSFEIELNWFEDSDEHNRIQTWQLLEHLHPGTLKFIKFRKWMDTMEHGRGAILTMSGWEEIIGSTQWKAVEELDILDENINMEVKDYINFNVVKLHLQAERIVIFSEQVKNHIKKSRITFNVNEEFDFHKAAQILRAPFIEIIPSKFLLDHGKDVYMQLFENESTIVLTIERRRVGAFVNGVTRLAGHVSNWFH